MDSATKKPSQIKVIGSKVWSFLNLLSAEAGVDNVPRLGAALAFYSLFSIGPTFLILATIASVIYRDNSMSGELVLDLSKYIGRSGAEVLNQMIQSSRPRSQTILGASIGLAGFLIAAGAAYRSLEDAINSIYHVRRSPQLIVVAGARKFATSTLSVILFGSILAFALFARTFAIDLIDKVNRDNEFEGVNVLGGIVTFLTLVLVLSAAYKYLAGARPKWLDVLIGSVVTALLVMIGQAGLQWYLASGNAGSLIGAAGSVVVIMIWVYYTSQIVLYGAELVKVIALSRGEQLPIRSCFVRVRPSPVPED